MAGGQLGVMIGRGVRSTVYAWGEAEAVKLLEPGTPSEWLVEEARLYGAAVRAGAPAPEVRSLVDVDGHPGLVSERIFGPSMWRALVEEPWRARELGSLLAHVQLDVAACPASYELPRQRDRLVAKIHVAADRYGDDLRAALDLVADVGEHLVLCHGDLHPGNVILADRGCVLVDWFDASRGVLAAELARSALMLDQHHEALLPSGGLAVDATAELRDAYVATACELSGATHDQLEPWTLAQRVARLAEGFGVDEVDALRALLIERTR